MANVAKLCFYLKQNFLLSQYMEGNLHTNLGAALGQLHPYNCFSEVLLELFQLITNLMP